MNQFDLFPQPAEQKAPPVWHASHEAAAERLDAFLPLIGRYAKTRNFDWGPKERSNISLLSPWIRRRLLTEEEVLRPTLQRYALSTAEKFIQEVFWRGYFKGWLEQRPDVWADYVRDVETARADILGQSYRRKTYEAALEGRTGIDCFDAWVHELIDHGYLHNHARMWFASIWIFTLRLPWQLGADFFYQHLLDADPASNTLSWRWVAGLHTKGKSYLARPDNIEKFTGGRFNGSGQLARSAEPLTEDRDYLQRPLSLAQQIPLDGSKDGSKVGLLITEEDVSLDWIPERCQITACFGLSLDLAPGLPLPCSAVPSPRSEKAQDFAQAAVHHGVTAAEHRFGVPGEVHHDPDLNWSDAVSMWAEAQKISLIVTATQPVGPTADRIKDATLVLARKGIELRQVRRTYDSLVWPHATRGFFKVKDKIPHILRELGLT